MSLNKVLTGALVVQLIIVGILLIMPAQSRTQPAEAQQQSNPCPAGSYDIGISKDGQPICKLEPTGCPYGDSIPLGPECDKHKPASDKDATPPDPDRPYYDAAGNKYDYQGNLIEPALSQAAQYGGK